MRVLKRQYPHAVQRPLDNTYGILLYSRLPLVQAKVEFLVEEDVPSIRAQVRLRSGDVVEVLALHPEPPQPFNDTLERDAELVIAGRRARRSPYPSIVLGDLNDVAWSATTRR